VGRVCEWSLYSGANDEQSLLVDYCEKIFDAASAHEGKCVCQYRGVSTVGVYKGHRLGWPQPIRRLKPVIPHRSVRESAEQRAQVDPRVDVQVRRQEHLDYLDYTFDNRVRVSILRATGMDGTLALQQHCRLAVMLISERNFHSRQASSRVYQHGALCPVKTICGVLSLFLLYTRFG
jgi:hypothetical protein